MTRRTPTALALAAVAALAAATPAAGASRTITLEGWPAREMAFSGDHLVWTEAATVRVDPRRIAGSPPGAVRFDYYRAETSRVRLAARSTRFAGAYETPVSVRTSIAAMTPGVLAPTGGGGFVTVPGSRRFAPPVARCCDADGIETVVESDGRDGAPVTVAATALGDVVRTVRLGAGGAATVRDADLASGAVTDTPVPGTTRAGLVALSATARAWVDPAAPATLLLQPTGGAAPEAVALPGAALRVWAAPGLAVVAVRRGARVLVVRVDEGAAPRAQRVWAGARLPRVAAGGGSVAVADGRAVLAARRGALRVVVRGRRVVDAVGVDGARVAWVERGQRRGARVGVVRLGRVR
ncbi:hypothetical protein [Miltoncostaea oceani]|uniref:hypothetical protein n=1 Tax=Miltoncostaea oceani TaxID=2843216 RepID=UPI001C3E1B0F|nr:hypothetical protein [Miltoncostaea oceani]